MPAWVMEMIADPVIDVVAVRDRLVTAVGAVEIVGLVSAAAVIDRTPLRVLARYRDHVFVNVIAVWVVQMAVVQIVGMAVMMHRRMGATGAVAMLVVRMATLGAGVRRDILSGADCDHRPIVAPNG